MQSLLHRASCALPAEGWCPDSLHSESPRERCQGWLMAGWPQRLCLLKWQGHSLSSNPILSRLMEIFGGCLILLQGICTRNHDLSSLNNRKICSLSSGPESKIKEPVSWLLLRCGGGICSLLSPGSGGNLDIFRIAWCVEASPPPISAFTFWKVEFSQ